MGLHHVQAREFVALPHGHQVQCCQCGLHGKAGLLDQVVARGTHAELLARGGLYAELERIQREGADEEDYAAAGAVT